MGAFLHILLCSAAAIGGYVAVGLTAPVPDKADTAVQATARFVEPGLMAVPLVHKGAMKGLTFFRLGVTMDAAAPLDEAQLGTLVADALYSSVLPAPAKAGVENPLAMGFLDLEDLRKQLAERVNATAGMALVQEVLVLQLDMRRRKYLRAPKPKADTIAG